MCVVGCLLGCDGIHISILSCPHNGTLNGKRATRGKSHKNHQVQLREKKHCVHYVDCVGTK